LSRKRRPGESPASLVKEADIMGKSLVIAAGVYTAANILAASSLPFRAAVVSLWVLSFISYCSPDAE
jgi:hypothetical protein